MSREDYYSLLGVDRQAPEREIRRAFYNLARELHPDKAKTPEEGRASAERLAVISKAYNTLKDPAKRAEYDGQVKPNPVSASGQPAAPARPAAPKLPQTSGAPSQPKTATTQGGSNAIPAGKVSDADAQAQRILIAQRAFVKGMEFWKNADFKSARDFFKAAVENDPESEPHYHMKYAICLIKSKGSFSRALEAAEKACEMDSYNIEFKLSLAEIYETAGVGSKAIAALEDVLRWEPDNQKAKMKLAVLKTAKNHADNPGVLGKIFPSLFKKK